MKTRFRIVSEPCSVTYNILVCHLLHKLAMNNLLIFHCLTFPDHV